MITRDRLQELLSFDPQTGQLTWLVSCSRSVKAGDIAGCRDKEGYIVVTIAGKQYRAHRLAWLLMFNEWCLIDHKDGNPSNNKLSNLRSATPSQNCANRRGRHGRLKGTSFHKKDRHWNANIMKDGVTKFLGCFKTETEAHAAYVAAAKEIHGEYARSA